MKKIIIAESILHAIEGSSTIFGRGGITLFTALSSEEILNLHGARKADLIVTDFALPLMGGVKLCSLIRNDAGLKDVSIIMVCDPQDASLVESQKSGANAVIPRPADAVELFLKVSELLLVPQRKDMRVLLRASVKGRDGKASFFASSQNVSISGMLLETDRELKKGDRLTCAFNIAHSEIVAECVITRAISTVSGRKRFGVKFINLDTKALIIIEQFVNIQARH